MSADPKRPRLHAVSGLRYLAALHLVVYHLALLGFIDVAALAPPVRAIIEAGYTTTGMFLVLSGFMLFYGYVDERGGLRTTARRLWWSRFAMLYPLAVVGQLLGLPSALLGADRMPVAEIGARVAAALTLTQAWIPPVAFSLDGPAWTLSCLAAFYLIFPWLAPRVARLSRRATIVALVATWIVAQGIVAAALLARPDLVASTGTDAADTLAVVLHALPVVRVWEFLSGVLLAHLVLGSSRAATGGAREAAPWWRSPDVALVSVLAALALLHGRAPFHLLHNGLLLPLHWLLIATLVAGGGMLGRLLATRPVVALGEASLPIFLLHVPLLHYVRHAAGRGWVEDGPVLVTVLGASITLLSWLVAHHFVLPMAAGLRAWRERRLAVSGARISAPVGIGAGVRALTPPTGTTVLARGSAAA